MKGLGARQHKAKQRPAGNLGFINPPSLWQ
jgi:hypothetical protein